MEKSQSKNWIILELIYIDEQHTQFICSWISGTASRSRLGFYNQNIDAIAEPCPICEELGGELANLEESELAWYAFHMEKEHGLVR